MLGIRSQPLYFKPRVVIQLLRKGKYFWSGLMKEEENVPTPQMYKMNKNMEKKFSNKYIDKMI